VELFVVALGVPEELIQSCCVFGASSDTRFEPLLRWGKEGGCTMEGASK
jgi:hypothetical protein